MLGGTHAALGTLLALERPLPRRSKSQSQPTSYNGRKTPSPLPALISYLLARWAVTRHQWSDGLVRVGRVFQQRPLYNPTRVSPSPTCIPQTRVCTSALHRTRRAVSLLLQC